MSHVSSWKNNNNKKKQINKPEYKKPHKNTIEANIKNDQEYKGGALTRTKFAWKKNNENRIYAL